MSIDLPRTIAEVEPPEAAQPSVKTSPTLYMSLTSDVDTSCVPHASRNSPALMENDKQLKYFLKLQSPTNSEFDSESESSGSEDEPTGYQLSDPEEQELCDSSGQVQQVTEDLFERQDLATEHTAVVSPTAVAHPEVGEPRTTRVVSEMVTGSNLSSTLMLSRLNYYNSLVALSKWQAKRYTNMQVTFDHPFVTKEILSLMAQQFVLTHGWKEHISQPSKRSLSDLEYTRDLVNGHPIGKCILNAFSKGAVYYRGDFLKKKVINSSQNTTSHRKLFSQEIDASISSWEKAFSQQFGEKRIVFKRYDITAHLLLVIMYRSAYQGSVYIPHFMPCHSECKDCIRCSLRVTNVMGRLDKNHYETCNTARYISSSKCDEKSTMDRMSKLVAHHEAEQIRLLYHHCEELARSNPYIEFPHVVEVGVQYRSKKYVKPLHIIYMQIPPYFYAVPADSSENTFRELEPHFPRVIQEIHKELDIERERFFDQKPDLRDEENLMMIYPYRFDPDGQPSDCRFLRVLIKVDEG